MNSASRNDQAEPNPARRVGPYQIISPLGVGGMGEVYLAEDQTLERRVALKFLSQVMEEDETARERFLREARTAAALDHPFICKVYEIGEEDGKPYIAMEYLRGQTLQQRMEAGPLDLDEALTIAVEVGEALVEAHSRGIVHRDLKPGNIMIGPRGHAKVLDFGLAKRVSSTQELVTQMEVLDGLTRPGATVGTLAYMSPEQLRGDTLDTRSDIFSFGILLQELITGVHPFLKAQAMETASSILRDAPAPVPSLGEDVKKILHKMLAKRPEDRYQTMDEVLEALHQIRQRLGLEEPWFSKPLPLALAALLLLSVLAVIWQISSRPQIPTRQLSSVAILPLNNLGEDSDYLALGISRGVTGRLARAGLQVTPWDTMIRYQGTRQQAIALAADLQRDAVLVGTLHDKGELLRAEVSLIDGQTGFPVWNDAFEHPFEELLDLESEIALAVARQMEGELSPEDEKVLATGDSSSVNAYDFFMQGSEQLYQETEAATDRALLLFDTALEDDPDMAEAHLGKGAVYIGRFFNGWDARPENLEMAEESFQKAIELGSELKGRQGLCHVYHERGQTEKALELAQFAEDYRQGHSNVNEIEVLSTQGIAFCLGGMETVGISKMEELIELDSANEFASWAIVVFGWKDRYDYFGKFGGDPAVHFYAGLGQLREGNTQNAIDHFQAARDSQAQNMRPTQFGLLGLLMEGIVYQQAGNLQKARQTWQQGARLVEDDLGENALALSDPKDMKRHVLLACFYGLLHHKHFDQQKEIALSSKWNLFDLIYLAVVLEKIGERDQAADLLGRILDGGRWGDYVFRNFDAAVGAENAAPAPLRQRWEKEKQIRLRAWGPRD